MKSACDYGEERLASLLYDDGDEAEIIEMRAHLAECAGCRAELEQLTSMKELLSAWPNAVNAPRMVYVNERAGWMARLRGWADEIGRLAAGPVLKPVVATAAVVLVLVATSALLDVRVAPDGRVEVGLAGNRVANDPISEPTAESTPISRDEFEQGISQAVAYMEDLFLTRSDEDRRLLLTMIDERMQEGGMAMSDQLRNVVDTALTDMQRQHENDLGLVYSAIDEWGVITATELQRMNTILASFAQSGPVEEE